MTKPFSSGHYFRYILFGECIERSHSAEGGVAWILISVVQLNNMPPEVETFLNLIWRLLVFLNPPFSVKVNSPVTTFYHVISPNYTDHRFMFKIPTTVIWESLPNKYVRKTQSDSVRLDSNGPILMMIHT